MCAGDPHPTGKAPCLPAPPCPLAAHPSPCSKARLAPALPRGKSPSASLQPSPPQNLGLDPLQTWPGLQVGRGHVPEQGPTAQGEPGSRARRGAGLHGLRQRLQSRKEPRAGAAPREAPTLPGTPWLQVVEPSSAGTQRGDCREPPVRHRRLLPALTQLQALTTPEPPAHGLKPFLRTPQIRPHPLWHRRQRPAAASRAACAHGEAQTGGWPPPVAGQGAAPVHPRAVGWHQGSGGGQQAGGSVWHRRGQYPASLPWWRQERGCPLGRRGPRGGAGG